jgi:hypothetical protein
MFFENCLKRPLAGRIFIGADPRHEEYETLDSVSGT